MYTEATNEVDMKVGRNEPCPCGSGKKYKHCHYDSDLEERQASAAAALKAAAAEEASEESNDDAGSAHPVPESSVKRGKGRVPGKGGNRGRTGDSSSQFRRGSQRGN